jgi:RNA polymerase sigma-70 factor (ECF subfamily)
VANPTGNCEAQWIERCRLGDREAFRLLYDAYKDKVYSFALYALNGDAAAAEDIAQEVFVRVFQNIAQFRAEAEFTTWLYRMTANACTDEFRRRKRYAPWGDVEVTASASSDFSRVELSTAVRAALAELSDEQRAAVLLKYFEELSYDEMANVLMCSKGTIASRLNRGLHILASKLAFLKEDEPERRTP